MTATATKPRDPVRRLAARARSRTRPVIQRASPADLAMLAMDAGPVPQQIGAVLVLDAGPDFDLATAERLLAERVRSVPRLRQRLVRTPPGCGRPVWVDDADFDLARHLRQLTCPAPGDQQALLELAATVVTDPLPRDWPLWSMVLVTGLAGDAVALVVVLHHVLADGLGGLAVLARLVDQAPAPAPGPFPRPPPPTVQLATDAWLARLAALGSLPLAWRTTRASIAAAGGLRPVRAARCSLFAPTGPCRRLGVARADLTQLRAVAHRHGGTVNDAVLAAVTGALHTLLEQRGEAVDALAVTVPIARHPTAAAGQLGNQLGAMLVVLPATGAPAQRLRQITATIRARKPSTTGSPAIAVVAPLFRAAATLGLVHWFMNHQRLWHTLVSNLRGPDQPVRLAGAPRSAPSSRWRSATPATSPSPSWSCPTPAP